LNAADTNTLQGDEKDQCAQNISSNVRIKKSRKLADHELTRASTPRVRARVADGGDAAAGGSSRRASDSILLGNNAFAIVRRSDQAVPGYYVHCPCHTYNDGFRRRACGKAISITQPDEETVILRLHNWRLHGLKMKREDGETDEDFRRRHVKYDSWQFGKLKLQINLLKTHTHTHTVECFDQQSLALGHVMGMATGGWNLMVIKRIVNECFQKSIRIRVFNFRRQHS